MRWLEFDEKKDDFKELFTGWFPVSIQKDPKAKDQPTLQLESEDYYLNPVPQDENK